MNVSSSTNTYQNMSAYQRPVRPENPVAPGPAPEKPSLQHHHNSEVYEASNGNAIVNNNGNLSLTPQGEVNVSNKQQANADSNAADAQAKRDSQRENAVDYVAYQSKKSRVEIYLSVATDSKVDLDDGTATIIESLRDTQKQNNTVQAYAQYQNNQKGVMAF